MNSLDILKGTVESGGLRIIIYIAIAGAIYLIYQKYYAKKGFENIPDHFSIDLMPEVGSIKTPSARFLPQEIASHPISYSNSIRKETFALPDTMRAPLYDTTAPILNKFEKLNDRITNAPQAIEHYTQPNGVTQIRDYQPGKDNGILLNA